MNKNILAAVGISLALILGGYGTFRSAQVVVKQSVGAISSPDIQSPFISVGGVREWKAHTDNLTQATTTICALQSPAATSTLSSANVYLSVSSTTASTVYLSGASTPYATTTNFGSIQLAANQGGAAVASTSQNQIFAPNTWFVVGMAGGTGSFSPIGSCQATWQQLSYF